MKCLRNIYWWMGVVAVAAPLYAQSVEKIPVSSGTGFFVNSRYVVTSNHIFSHGCSAITLQRSGVDIATAKISLNNPDLDIAVLDASKSSAAYATLREDSQNLKAADGVMVMGYPADAGAQPHYEVANGQVINPADSFGNTAMLQFSDITKQGYSGGPLFDTSGNVVGVIKGQAKIYTTETVNGVVTGEKKFDKQIDEAINVITLEDFLMLASIEYHTKASAALLDKPSIEALGKTFVVNVQCVEK